MKKTYIVPAVEIVGTNMSASLLAGSGVPNSDQDKDGGNAKQNPWDNNKDNDQQWGIKPTTPWEDVNLGW